MGGCIFRWFVYVCVHACAGDWGSSAGSLQAARCKALIRSYHGWRGACLEAASRWAGPVQVSGGEGRKINGLFEIEAFSQSPQPCLSERHPLTGQGSPGTGRVIS